MPLLRFRSLSSATRIFWFFSSIAYGLRLGLFPAEVAWGEGTREIFGPPEPSEKEKAARLAAEPPKPAPVKITAEDARQLRAEFQRAIASRLKAFDHQNELELAEMKADEAAVLRAWEAEQARRKQEFFEANRGPSERRQFLLEQEQARRAHVDLVAKDRLSRTREIQVKRKAIEDRHRAKLTKFEESLAKLEKPADDLWP
ncbi:MAG: hypothetical protein AB7P04_03585 [Bacteriovoracia bacterium]